MSAEVQFRGLDQVTQALAQLPTELQISALRKGIKWACDALKLGMQTRAPRAAQHRVVRGGKSYPTPLADSIVTRIRSTRTGDPRGSVGPSSQAFWGLFVERGTKYQTARPFMVPTMEIDAQIALAAFVAGAAGDLEATVRRAKAR